MPNPTPEEMRELDARVAREIFHAKWEEGASNQPGWWELPNGKMLRPDPFTPTRDIAAAWSVVEKMRAMGYAWQACQTWDGPDNDPKSEPGGWSFMHKDDDKYEREGESQIRPSECPVALAISLAALAALSASNSQTKEG